MNRPSNISNNSTNSGTAKKTGLRVPTGVASSANRGASAKKEEPVVIDKNADPLAIALKKRHVNGKVVPDAVKEVGLKQKNEVTFRLR